ncbi:penicillin-insensitive murein endopeptidase [Abyssibius alkaniclasticus]|uniref:penicillin-insensitive murein endopeptidase n=1 Tax=Abyssibius alkaniclasticus TaxID=2881234 RepID=UPI004059D9E7
MRFGFILAALLAFAAPALAQTPAKELFGAQTTASRGWNMPIGSYARGCLRSGDQLAETGPAWQAMRLSRNRNWGHPSLISFIERLGAAAQGAGWAGIYVGDMSQPRGGPMLTGHSSHQIGLDADIWMLPPRSLNLSPQERETISSVNVATEDFSSVSSNWTASHMAVIRAAASDPAVARIFVTPAAKIWMCENATGDRSWLRTLRPWWGHNYHFHVRLSCPRGAGQCEDQAPPPPGDGCAEAQTFLNNMLNPPPPPPPDPNAPPPRPRGPLTLADLPNQCAAVLRR